MPGVQPPVSRHFQIQAKSGRWFWIWRQVATRRIVCALAGTSPRGQGWYPLRDIPAGCVIVDDAGQGPYVKRVTAP